MFSASQEIPHILKPEGAMLCSQQPATGPCQKPDTSIPHSWHPRCAPTIFHWRGGLKPRLYIIFFYFKNSVRNTVVPRKSNGLILELETRTKNSRKIRFETRIKIRKSNHERGIAQHPAAHATVSQQIRTRLIERCWSVCASARPVLP
jgi:hypothetical protein